MKNLRILFFLMLGAGLFFITGCSTTDNTDVKPTINFKGGASYVSDNVTLEPNTTFTVGVNAAENASTKKNLDNFTVTRTGIVSATPVDTNISGSNFAWERTFTTATAVGVETWTFTVTDNAGESAEVSFIITTAYPGFATEKTGEMFYHIAGSLKGSFDLVGDSAVSAAGNSLYKDMQNTDSAGTTFTGSWTAGNSTTFVKSNSYDYANATSQSAATAYNAGTVQGTVTSPSVGDIYIAKLRGGSEYVAIKITEIAPTDNTCNCGNKGKIVFSYKKD